MDVSKTDPSLLIEPSRINLEEADSSNQVSGDQSFLDVKKKLFQVHPIHIAAVMGSVDATSTLLKCPETDINAMTTLNVLEEARDKEGFLQNMDLLGRSFDSTLKTRHMTALHLASHYGHHEIVSLLLANNAKFDFSKDPCDQTSPLSLVEYGLPHPRVIQVLLDSKIRLFRRILAQNYNTCAEGGFTETLDVLANAGIIYPDLRDGKTLRTGLHLAAWNGFPDTVRKLLDLGASQTIFDYKGYSPLHFACFRGHLEVVRVLLDQDRQLVNAPVEPPPWESRDRWQQTPLSIACERGYKDIVQVLVECGADLTQLVDGDSCLHVTLKGSYKYSVAAKGVEALNRMRKVQLEDAQRRLEIADMIISQRPELVNVLDVNGLSPLYRALQRDWHDMVELLLEKGCDVNNVCPVALKIAAKDSRSYKTTKLLIDHGADVKILPELVRFVVGNNDLPLTTLILDNGGDMLNFGPGCQSCLHVSARDNFVEIVKLLLNRAQHLTVDEIFNAWTESQDWHAISEGKTRFSQTIDADSGNAKENYVNLTDTDGWTALHYAASNGHQQVVDILLMEGARANKVARNFVSPHMLAALGGFASIAVKLKEAETETVTDLNERVFREALSKGIPIEERDVDIDEVKQKIENFEKVCSKFDVGRQPRLSELAQTHPKFNDEVETKPWLPTSWKKDGFVSVKSDLLAMVLQPCCSIKTLKNGEDKPTLNMVEVTKCQEDCLQREECAKANALLAVSKEIQSFLQSSECEFSCLKPRLDLIGSMVEGTRLGGADEIDMPLTFKIFQKHPFVLGKSALATDLPIPGEISFLQKFKLGNEGFSYSKFLNGLCSSLKSCLRKMTERGAMPGGLNCDLYWTPCAKCQLADPSKMLPLKHCESCFPGVTYSKLGVCLIFSLENIWGGRDTLTFDLIPIFELDYLGSDTTLSQRVFATLYCTQPQGWVYHCDQMSHRDRMLMDRKTKDEIMRCKVTRRQEVMTLKLLNDLDEISGPNYVIRTSHKTDTGKFAVSAIKTHYIVLKALTKTLDMEEGGYLIKKHLLAHFTSDTSAYLAEREKPLEVVTAELPKILLALELRATFDRLIDLPRWSAAVSHTVDVEVLGQYVPLREDVLDADGRYERNRLDFVERCYRDFGHECAVQLKTDPGFTKDTITEGDVLAGAHYFLTRRPHMVEKALETLQRLWRANGCFADQTSAVDFALKAIRIYSKHHRIQIKALKLLFLMTVASRGDDVVKLREIMGEEKWKSSSPVTAFAASLFRVYCQERASSASNSKDDDEWTLLS